MSTDDIRLKMLKLWHEVDFNILTQEEKDAVKDKLKEYRDVLQKRQYEEQKGGGVMNCYPEKKDYMGHKATHICNGIYRIDEPYVVHISKLVDSSHNDYYFGLRTVTGLMVEVILFNTGYDYDTLEDYAYKKENKIPGLFLYAPDYNGDFIIDDLRCC